MAWSDDADDGSGARSCQRLGASKRRPTRARGRLGGLHTIPVEFVPNHVAAPEAAGEVRLGHRSVGNWLWVAVAVSLTISLTPWALTLLYPFRLLTTWVHECGHALMTILVGGRVMSIAIAPDGSGLTESVIPDGRVTAGVVASSGISARPSWAACSWRPHASRNGRT
jgi:Peptidase M50B-like